ncbi:helix-turn-helix transcriptional regulator [Streptosporangiaceae bacterium NEAU-GS5]|nr:helix-turn-helix transcriptional regulator [Streptosporangiaceae bacterium NEAU-GS5]
MLLVNLGCAALADGDLDEARPPIVEGLRVAREIDDRVAQYCLLDALGCHAAGTGAARLAARLLGAAHTAQTSVGARILPYLAPLVARAAATTRAALGQAGFEAEYAAGQRLDRDAAIGMALGEPEPSADGPAVDMAYGDMAVPPLAKREAEVARLVAEGLSNRQIGARLLISEHTVDSHIRSILNKLGFNSRTQIAAWMASLDRGV